jgi:hypothetical protein
MMRHQAQEGRSPAGRPRLLRLLPIAGGGVAIGALLAHVGGGALLMHVGLPAVLAYFGLSVAPANLGGGALVIGIMATTAMMLLLVFGAGRWLRQWLRHR